MSNPQQEPLEVNDIVEIQDDYREFLNGKRGKIFDIFISGNRAYVEVEGVHVSERRVTVSLDNLRKVETKHGSS